GAHEPEPVRQLAAVDRDVDAAGVVAQPATADRRRARFPAQRVEPTLERLERAVGRAVAHRPGSAFDLVAVGVRKDQSTPRVVAHESEALHLDIGIDTARHTARASYSDPFRGVARTGEHSQGRATCPRDCWWYWPRRSRQPAATPMVCL